MSETVRSIRRSTNAELNRERQYAKEQIEALQKQNREAILRLEKERDRQMEEYYKQLRMLEAEQRTAVKAAEHRIDAEMSRHEALLRENMNNLRKETERQLKEQKKEFEEKLKELYDEIDRRLKNVMDRMNQMKADEQALADEQVRELEEQFEKICKDDDVHCFQADYLTFCLQPRVKKTIEEFNLHNWTIATSKALIAITDCDRVLLEARHEREKWDKRLAVVTEKLEALKALVAVLIKNDSRISIVGRTWRGCLKIWNEEEIQTLSDMIESMEKLLIETKIGSTEILDMLDVDLSSLGNSKRLETAIEYAERCVHAYILAYQVLRGIKSTAGVGWVMETGGALTMKQPENRGSMILINGRNDEIVTDICLAQGGLVSGTTAFTLNIAYHGTRNMLLLTIALNKILGDLEKKLQEDQYGRMHSAGRIDYIDEFGYPAVRITLEHSTADDPLIGVSEIRLTHEQRGGLVRSADTEEKAGSRIKGGK